MHTTILQIYFALHGVVRFNILLRSEKKVFCDVLYLSEKAFNRSLIIQSCLLGWSVCLVGQFA